MKGLLRLILVIGLGILSWGCVRSGIEGKVMDGKGQPMAGLQIIAQPVPPIKGYDHSETATTGPDGSFQFTGLFSSWGYSLSASDPNWKTEAKILTQSGPEGQTSLLPSPFVIRFVINKDGVVIDNRTGLQWAPDPGRRMTWDQADQYVRGLRLGGFSDWRLPDRAELRGLGIDAGDPAIKFTATTAWTSERRDSSSAWVVNFGSSYPGGAKEDYCLLETDIPHALAVRSQE